MANTTIHPDGLTFRSISSNGAVNGIILNNTGASGGLTVSGTGGAGTGGTIQSSTGNGISLTNTRDVVLNSMVLDNNRLRQRETSTFRLERFVGNGAVDTDVEAFITGQNPLIDNADATHATTFTGVANGFCAKP